MAGRRGKRACGDFGIFEVSFAARAECSVSVAGPGSGQLPWPCRATIIIIYLPARARRWPTRGDRPQNLLIIKKYVYEPYRVYTADHM